MKIPKILKMMGTKEDVLKKEEDKALSATQELNVLNDMDIYELDLDFNKGNIMEKLRDSIAKTEISSRMMNEPRPNFPLLVLDLDHTLLDFDSKSSNFAKMKRPYMHEFLGLVYQHFDLVIWSQTSWKWLEIKLIELGFLSHRIHTKSFSYWIKNVCFGASLGSVKQVEKKGKVRRLNRWN